MATETEGMLENQLLAQLQTMGYSLVSITNEKELIANLKTQLEKHNNTTFSAQEFERVLNILSKGSVFEKAKTLREPQRIVRDNGESCNFEFIKQDFWCQNEFQVTHQVTMEGKYENRYDITILINGLPLVQIELKRRGLGLKEAFNQINRYQAHSFGASAALFQYIQIFVISNGVNTKYYANNKIQTFKQTFYWTDKENKHLTNVLNGFTSSFLEPCHLSKMICKYIVLNETYKVLMVLRPYQYYAVEALVDRVKNSTQNAYIWHTTGSGKTLTSFKASQILTTLPQVKKVVFVVDRKDLDYQTTKEFNYFSKGSVDGTENTQQLVKQFSDDTKLIVTTIQKLNTAITKKQHLSKMELLKDERIVFIFDECHRSQFGETHKKIKDFFNNIQLFGFTGTPIFADNAAKNDLGKRTTKELFDECLHKYVITDAIRDENVLKFSVEYIGKAVAKPDSVNNVDIEVEEIDTRELMESPKRLEKVVDYILDNHDKKTHNRSFNAIFCINNIDTLKKYYDIFQQKKEAGKHNLRIATVFSYTANEEDANANGILTEDFAENEDGKTLSSQQVHSREKLEEYIGHYNQLFGTKFSTKDSESFYNYYNDISKNVKNRNIDILLVVNMFLTGFDSPTLNTLYVDKNLKYHGLIQAYSRTNRILDEKKSQGNIVVFRNLKDATDEALTLFCNKEAIDTIIMQPYEDYVQKYEAIFSKLQKIAPTVDSINSLPSETEELEFVQTFRELIRTQNVLSSFADFTWEDLPMEEQTFDNYKSKYLDLHDKVKTTNSKEKVSVLKDIDFELELIHRDDINVAYILQLLMKLKSKPKPETEQAVQNIMKLLNSETNLRSKRELIEKFINQILIHVPSAEEVPDAFEKFWNEEQRNSFAEMVKTENLSPEKTQDLISQYLYDGKEPLIDELISLIIDNKPTFLKRKEFSSRILAKIKEFIATFIEGRM